jgi:hypothetical protein
LQIDASLIVCLNIKDQRIKRLKMKSSESMCSWNWSRVDSKNSQKEVSIGERATPDIHRDWKRLEQRSVESASVMKQRGTAHEKQLGIVLQPVTLPKRLAPLVADAVPTRDLYA